MTFNYKDAGGIEAFSEAREELRSAAGFRAKRPEQSSPDLKSESPKHPTPRCQPPSTPGGGSPYRRAKSIQSP
jgi:hypothetical protein